MAFTCQHPEVKIRWQILCTGPARTGKTLSVEPLRRIFGGHCKTVEVISDEKYDDSFVESKVIIFEEVKGDRKNYNNLKSKFANNNVETLNPKSKPKVTQQNTYSIYMFSNHDDALSIDREGDKLLVVKGPALRLEKEFYTEIGSSFEKGQLTNFVYDYLLTRDISKFQYGSLPVRTQAAKDMALEADPDKDAIEYLLEQAENQYGIFQSVALNELSDEGKALYEMPIVTRDIVRQDLREKGFWNKYLEVTQILDAVGYVLLPRGQLKNFGKTPSIYVPKGSKVVEMSTGERYRWIVNLFLLNHNEQLLNKEMKRYVKLTSLTRVNILEALDAAQTDSSLEMLS
jgi:hypothetical protein